MAEYFQWTEINPFEFFSFFDRCFNFKSTKTIELNFALDQLDELVTGSLSPDSPNMRSPEERLASDLLKKVKEDTDSIRKYLWSVPEIAANKKQLRVIVMQFHQSLTLLSEILKGYLIEVDKKNSIQSSLYESVLLQINNVLSFIQRHFSFWISDNGAEKNTFLHTVLNEAEISALLCAIVDTDIVNNHSYTSLFDFLAPRLATKHKKGLIASSMLKSKDKLTPEMKRRLKALILEMARLVEQY